MTGSNELYTSQQQPGCSSSQSFNQNPPSFAGNFILVKVYCVESCEENKYVIDTGTIDYMTSSAHSMFDVF